MKKRLLIVILLILGLLPLGAQAKKDSSTGDLEEIRRVQDSQSKILAEAVQKIESIRGEIQTMKGALEENRHFIDQQTENNDKHLKEFDLRISAMEEKLSLFENQIDEIFQEPSGKKNPARSEKEETLYKRALAEINAQNFKGAISLLNEYLKAYPKSSLADNAQYWKGECLYASKQFPEAILEFQNVVKKYPKSNKVPAAILKQGYSFFESKKFEEAKIFLQKVVSDYPLTEEAIKAREKIKRVELAAKESEQTSEEPPTPAKPSL